MSLCLLLFVVSIWISFFLYDLDFSFVTIFLEAMKNSFVSCEFYYAMQSVHVFFLATVPCMSMDLF